MTQQQQILEYLRKHGSITTLEAVYNLGCTKLTTRISELRRKGYNIRGEKQTGIRRESGITVHYNRYTLEEDKI